MKMGKVESFMLGWIIGCVVCIPVLLVTENHSANGYAEIVNPERQVVQCSWKSFLDEDGCYMLEFSSAMHENVFKHLPDNYFGSNMSVYGEKHTFIKIGRDKPVSALKLLAEASHIVSWEETK